MDAPSLHARFLSRAATHGVLGLSGRLVPCRFGRAGLTGAKREGDGATPLGEFPLRRLLYRPDRMARPACALPALALAPDMGWCDDPTHPAYNQLIRLPFPARHEIMWRADHVYDLCIEIGYNDDPAIPGRGSAIFLHLTADDDRPTEGCVATSRAAMHRLLPQLRPGTRLTIA